MPLEHESSRDVPVVEQAVGVLLAEGVGDVEDARAALSQTAAREGKTVAEVAAALCARAVRRRSTTLETVISDFALLGDAVATAAPQDALGRLTSLATQRLPGAASASITISSRRGMDTIAATDELARQVDNLQYEAGEGPCIQAIEDGAAYAPLDLVDDERWPRFARGVASLDVRSVLSYPLARDADLGDDRASLNVYGRPPRAFNARDILVGSMLAAHASATLLTSRYRNQLDNLGRALESNREIGSAIGILMHKHRLTREAAFDALRVASQHSNRKLRDVATDVVDTGELDFHR